METIIFLVSFGTVVNAVLTTYAIYQIDSLRQNQDSALTWALNEVRAIQEGIRLLRGYARPCEYKAANPKLEDPITIEAPKQKVSKPRSVNYNRRVKS
jgi:hypothetical protein